MVSINERLESLKSASEELDAACGSLNSKLAEVVAYLYKLKLGVEASFPLFDLERTTWRTSATGERECFIQKVWLNYERGPDGKWGLFVQDETRDEGDQECLEMGELRPLATCSREIRIEALNALPELIAVLEERTREKIAQLDKAQKSIQE